ncbi:hypothetical protein [Paenibacillus hamazuiensis]|uniref:hypothetical protein n=1 Tax=Paenibacillus hamazuiensis TaxID=2936508 RepID=UPI00200BCDDB|nr:hypothetical protein [Paenibacillus hamazuiensis]
MADMGEQRETEHRITQLEAAVKQSVERLNAHDKAFEKINEKVEDIVKLLSARPTWLITILLTVLTTTTASLIVYVTTQHR